MMETLGGLFKLMRESKGLSMRDVAKELGISPTTVCDIETGNRKGKNPTAKTLIAFCDLYELPIGPILELLRE
jgi:transcriptional regulator with XRE-family HTH domain